MPRYTQQEILDWTQSLTNLPEKIAVKRTELLALGKEIEDDKNAVLHLIADKLTPIQNEISTLEAKINVLVLPVEIEKLKSQLEEERAEVARIQSQRLRIVELLEPIEKEIHTYNQTLDYMKKNERIEIISRLISEKTNLIRSEEVIKHAKKAECDSLVAQLNSLYSRISTLRTEQDMDAISHIYHHHHHHYDGGYHSSIGHHIADSIHAASDVSLSFAIGDLESQYSALQTRKNLLENNITSHQSTINNLSYEVTTLNREASDLRLAKDRLAKEIGWMIFLTTQADIQYRLDKKIAESLQPKALICELDAKLTVTASRVNLHQNEFSAKTQIYTNALGIIELPVETPIITLREQLAKACANRDELNAEKSHLEHAIINNETNLMEKDVAISSLLAQLDNAKSNHFLNALTQTPAVLCRDLTQVIKRRVEEYELAHPAGQSLIARMMLHDIAQHVHLINSTHAENDYRLRFYRLSGLIWSAYHKLKNVDRALAEQIYLMLEKDGINEAEATAAYDEFCKSNPLAVNNIWPELLLTKEINEFNKAEARLREALTIIPENASGNLKSLYDSGDELLNAIKNEIPKPNTEEAKTFDWKFHTNLLNKATSVLTNPYDASMRESFKTVAKHNQSGKPSLSKRISGAALMFVGVAAIVAGATLQCLTLGVISPVGIGCIAGGTALFASGLSLFCHGRTKAQEKALRQFTNAAENLNNHAIDLSIMTPSAPAI